MSRVIDHLFSQTKCVTIDNRSHKYTPERVRSLIGDFLNRLPSPPAWWEQDGLRAPYRIFSANDYIVVAWLPIADNHFQYILPLIFQSAVSPMDLPVPVAPTGANTITLELRTPYCQGKVSKVNSDWKGRPVIDFMSVPDMKWLLSVTACDLSRLNKTYGGEMKQKPELMRPHTERAQREGIFRLVGFSGKVVQTGHYSQKKQRMVRADGWTGIAQYQGTPEEVARWYPWLVGASIWGIGSGTTWGNAALFVDAWYEPERPTVTTDVKPVKRPADLLTALLA